MTIQSENNDALHREILIVNPVKIVAPITDQQDHDYLRGMAQDFFLDGIIRNTSSENHDKITVIHAVDIGDYYTKQALTQIHKELKSSLNHSIEHKIIYSGTYIRNSYGAAFAALDEIQKETGFESNPIIIFAQTDTRQVGKNSYISMADLIKQSEPEDNKIGLVGALSNTLTTPHQRAFNYDPRTLIASKRGLPGTFEAFDKYVLGKVEIEMEEPKDVPYIMQNSFAMSSEYYKSFTDSSLSFPKQLFASATLGHYGIEPFLAHTMRKKGYRIVVDPDALIMHMPVEENKKLFGPTHSRKTFNEIIAAKAHLYAGGFFIATPYSLATRQFGLLWDNWPLKPGKKFEAFDNNY